MLHPKFTLDLGGAGNFRGVADRCFKWKRLVKQMSNIGTTDGDQVLHVSKYQNTDSCR